MAEDTYHYVRSIFTFLGSFGTPKQRNKKPLGCPLKLPTENPALTLPLLGFCISSISGKVDLYLSSSFLIIRTSNMECRKPMGRGDFYLGVANGKSEPR